MAKLTLSVAVGNYDRMRPLSDGEVQIDGVDPVFMLLEPEEIFFRAFRHAAFDVCELSLSSFTVRTARGDCPYVGLPVFPSRAFRHTAIYVRRDRVTGPADLKGRRVGSPEYQLTANVWARALLEDEFGVRAEDVTWVRGGLEQAGRVEKITFEPPPGLRLEQAPDTETLSGLLERGEIDGIIAPRAPSCFGRNEVGWLFPDPVSAASEYYRRTRIFPIMHLLGLRRELARPAPLAARRVGEGVHACQGDCAGAAGRSRCQQGYAAFRRRAPVRGACIDGGGFLVVRRGGQPGNPGDLPAPPSSPGIIGAIAAA